MALVDRLTKPAPSFTGIPCSVGALLGTCEGPKPPLEGAELAALQTMIAAPSAEWPSTRIWREVTDEGHTIGKQSIGRHRRQDCRCYQGTAANSHKVSVRDA